MKWTKEIMEAVNHNPNRDSVNTTTIRNGRPGRLSRNNTATTGSG